MKLFKPNLNCYISKNIGTNVYGEEQLNPPIKERCAIVKLKVSIESSSVRADASASKGAAREFHVEAKILFPVNTAVVFDDQIIVAEHKLRVVGIFPRHNINGVLDHYEIHAVNWGKQ